jgi:hypothetical protein
VIAGEGVRIHRRIGEIVGKCTPFNWQSGAGLTMGGQSAATWKVSVELQTAGVRHMHKQRLLQLLRPLETQQYGRRL